MENLTRLSDNKRGLLILLDNCSIHKTKTAMKRAKELNIELLFNVPYSPWFNGIELVWAMAKK